MHGNRKSVLDTYLDEVNRNILLLGRREQIVTELTNILTIKPVETGCIPASTRPAKFDATCPKPTQICSAFTKQKQDEFDLLLNTKTFGTLS